MSLITKYRFDKKTKNKIIDEIYNYTKDEFSEGFNTDHNFNKAKNEKNFGNGRYVRNLFEKVKFEQADRVIQSNSKAINSITNRDIESAINGIQHNEKEKRKIGFCS